MLEIRYKKDTGEITASASSPKFTGGHLELKEGERIAVLDIPTPETMEAWLYDEKKKALIPNPDYVEPVIRDPLTEIDALEARIKKLEKKGD